MPVGASPTRSEQELIAAARGGEEAALRDLLDAHRADLHAQCYRMLGSRSDAEDALQDALVRAWRALPRFDGRSAFRTWLYRIATNASLDLMDRRQPQVVPIDGPQADPQDGQVAVEIRDTRPGPDVCYEQRESVELAFEAAQRLLPPSQRAVLILREILGYSAAETADMLDTSVASVNSALQRARSTMVWKRVRETEVEFAKLTDA
jgi:RNA polymerase sigma-70 factor, ECF subfamily